MTKRETFPAACLAAGAFRTEEQTWGSFCGARLQAALWNQVNGRLKAATT
jgi:hypothetical protein